MVAASRTDAGVHAKGQVVSFRTEASLPIKAFTHGLNHHLPEDIAVRAAYKVSDAFNVQRDAVSREYRYCILNSATRSPLWRKYSYLVRGNLNLENMSRACQALVGVHDFASFVTEISDNIKSTVRNVLHAGIARKGELVLFDIKANSFLPHQVRNTVGALLKVGMGDMSVDEFRGIIEAKKLGLAGPTVPACGLCLMQVNYPDPFQESDGEDL